MSKKREMMLQLSKGCNMYDPCPICYNCMNKASHLYVRCQTCEVPHDAHTHKNRSFLIRRENFAIKLSRETEEKLKAEFAKRGGQ